MDSVYKVLVARVDENADKNIGSATKSNSVSGLVSTLVPVALTAFVFLVIFLFLRRFEIRQYAPRTYIRTIPAHKRTPALPKTWFSWIVPFWKMPDAFVLQHNSLDAYLFLRFLKVSCALSLFGALLTWPILFPVNATGGNGAEQLDLISMSNVKDPKRFYAHVFVSWIFFGSVLYLISRETIYYINLRQAYLLSPLYSHRVSQRTVLFNSVPDEFVNEAKIRAIFGNDVARVWINYDSKELDKLVKERDKVAYGLEAAETKLIVLANKNHAKNSGDAEAASSGGHGDDASGSIARRYVPDKKRPTHKLKFLIGKKVDTIDWSRERLKELIPLVNAEQQKHRNREGKVQGSIFVKFKTQEAAQAAVQSVSHHLPLHMAPRFIGITPREVVWSSLKIKWWERNIRELAVLAFVVTLIIFWSIPVAFVGIVSNINFLTVKVPFLSFINKIPPVILGVVTGLLPTIMLAVLLALVPIIMRLVSKLAGAPSLAVVELKTQNYFFAFQVVQGFLVTTLSSAATAAAAQIVANPSSAISLLSTSLPKASNFYINYIILQGLTISSGKILQIVGLLLAKVLGRFLDNTPRKQYKRWANLGSLGWGTLYPVFTLLIVIAITYAIIAPLVLGFACIGFALIYLAFRYNLLYTADSVIDTEGLAYSQALSHLLVGVYLAEVCLIGLFAVNKAPGPIVLEVIMLVGTVLFHIRMGAAFNPLKQYLPKNKIVEERLLSEAEGLHNAGNNGVNGANNGINNGHRGVSEKEVDNAEKLAELRSADSGAPTKKPNFIAKFFRPDIHCEYKIMRRLVPKDFPEIRYTDEELEAAYLNPSVGSETPLLWIPRDQQLGVSDQEVRHTNHVIPISNENASLDEKFKVQWNEEVDPPIYEEPKEW